MRHGGVTRKKATQKSSNQCDQIWRSFEVMGKILQVFGLVCIYQIFSHFCKRFMLFGENIRFCKWPNIEK